MSPIGGQASLRVLNTANATTGTAMQVRYMSSNSSYSDWKSASRGPADTTANVIFTTSLLSPQKTKESPRDAWNNVKVPMIESIQVDDSAENNGWFGVPDHNVTYSSLVGNFSIETSYMILQCSDITNGSKADDFKRLSNTTSPDTWSDGWYSTTPGGRGTTFWSNTTTCRRGLSEPRLIGIDAWDDLNVTYSLRSTWTTYVELAIECQGQECAATRIRCLIRDHRSNAATFLDDSWEEGVCNRWLYFFSNYDRTVRSGSSGSMNLREGYLIDPVFPASERTQLQSLTSIDSTAYSIRLAQLLNSYWLICAGPYAIVYGFAGEPEPSRDASSSYPRAFVSLKIDTMADAIWSYETLRCSNAWLVVLLASSLLVLLASVSTIILRLQRNTPELLLNWTTLVRHSHYIGTSDVGSFVDDAERSRLLGNMKIRFGDVTPHKEVGHLAIGARDRSSRISEKSARDLGFE